MRHVEDWKILVPCFNIFPTIPLTFDNLYSETYWPIVNKYIAVVRRISELDKEIRENEKKKMAEK